MKTLPSLCLSLASLCAIVAAITSQTTFLIPIPAAFTPTTKFGCPDTGTVFTYNVPAWNTHRPNRMIAVEEDRFNCRIRSDAQGIYDSAALVPILATRMLRKKI
jgi:hypothetical protein